jgi:hypothetical protein
MVWYQVIAPSGTSMRKVLKSYTNGKARVVKSNAKAAFIQVGEGHGWTKDVAKDFGCTLTETQEPRIEVAPCGQETVSATNHSHACPKCMEKRGKVPKKRLTKTQYQNSDSETLFKVPELVDTEFSVNGLISVFKAKRDQAMEIAEGYDKVIEAIERADAIFMELSALQIEQEEHKKALTHFLGS